MILLQHLTKKNGLCYLGRCTNDPRAKHIINGMLESFLITAAAWPMSRGHHLSLINYLPSPQQRLQELEKFPWHSNYKWWSARAKAQAQFQQRPMSLEAIASQQQAIAIAPHLMPLRRALVQYYDLAIRLSPQAKQKEQLKAQQEQAQHELKKLRPVVHVRHK